VARSLLQIGGAVRVVATYADSVLVVIDAQEEYRSGILRLDGIDAAAAALAVLLERARQAGTPVIHIVQRGRPGGLFDPGSTGAILPEATPVAGEAVVEKPLPNSFAGTDLQVRLQATGRTTLLLAGFMTHMCVSATARAALDLGWRTTVIADTTATRALPDPLGGADIPAESVHRTALAELADRYAVVARLDEIR
jgi:nicotinamidase-related amidase